MKPEMGDEVKLSCFETCRHNNASELRDIFLGRFKHSDEFWRDLFNSKCPEGLGEVNIKLINDENLFPSDFKILESTPVYESGGSCRTGNENRKSANVVEFKTPLLIKSLSSTLSSPLFSPVAPVDYNVQKGPNSSTPLPWKSAVSAHGIRGCTITPTSTRTCTSFKTPTDGTQTANFLDETVTSTKATTTKLSRSLSATLEMDTLDHMNVSWSSSLATPPEQDKKPSANSLSLPGPSTSDISKTVAEARIAGEAGEMARSSKGVARVLIFNESKTLERSSFADEGSVESDLNLETSAMLPASFNIASNDENITGSMKVNENSSKTASVSTDNDTKTSEGRIGKACEESACVMVEGDGSTLVTCDFLLQRSSSTENVSRYKTQPRENGNNTGNIVAQTTTISSDDKHHQYENNVGSEEDRKASSLLNGERKEPQNAGNQVISQNTSCRRVEHKETGDYNGNEVTKNSNPNDSENEENESVVRIKDVDAKPSHSSENTKIKDVMCDNHVRKVDDPGQVVRDNTMSVFTESDESVDYDHHNSCPPSSEKNDIRVDRCENQDVSEPAMFSKIPDRSCYLLTDHPNFLNSVTEETVHQNFKNVFDMDALSEFPVDFDFSQGTEVAPIFNLGQKSNGNLSPRIPTSEPKKQNLKQFSDDLHVSDQVDGHADVKSPSGESKIVTALKNDIRSTSETICFKSTEVSENRSLNNVLDLTRLKKANDEGKNENLPVPFQQSLEAQTSKSAKNVETASQVLQDLSLQHLYDTSFDASSLRTNENDLNGGPALASVDNPTNSEDDNKHFAGGSDKKIGNGNDPSQNYSDDMSGERKMPVNSIQGMKNDFKRRNSSSTSTVLGHNTTVTEQAVKNCKEELNSDEQSKDDESHKDTMLELSAHSNNTETTVSKAENDLDADTHEKQDVSCSEKISVVPEKNYNPVFGNISVFNSSIGKSVDHNSDNVFDMEALSELPLDFSLTQGTAVPATSNGGENSNRNFSSSKNLPDNLSDQVITSELLGVECHAEVPKISTTVKSDPRSKPESLLCRSSEPFDVVEKKNFTNIMKPSGTQNVSTVTMLYNKEIENEYENSFVSFKRKVSETSRSIEKVENASHVLQDLSLQHLGDISFEAAGISDLRVTEGDLNKTYVVASVGKVAKINSENEHFVGDCNTKMYGTYGSLQGCFSDEKKIRNVYQDKNRRLILGSASTASTVSGRSMAVSEEEMKNGEGKFGSMEQANEDDCQEVGSGKWVPGDCVENGRKRLNYVDRNEEHDHIGRVDENTFSGFKTASGKKVGFSEESLNKAKRLLNNINAHEENKFQSTRRVSEDISSGFSTASEKKVTVSKRPLEEARRIMRDVGKDEETCQDERGQGDQLSQDRNVSEMRFSTKSDNSAAFNQMLERAYKTTDDVVDNELNHEDDGPQSSSAKVGFSIHYGKEVAVSEGSEEYKTLIVDEVDELQKNAFHDIRRTDANSGARFSTASSKEMAVSEASLKKAKRILNEVDRDREESCYNMRRRVGKSTIGFSTASGKKVTVSEESLKKAKRIVNEVKSDEELLCRNTKRMEEKSCVGFSTVSGKKIDVSEESLKKAKRILNGVESDEELSCRNTKEMKEKSCVGFSTASGKKVDVSKESLKKAKGILNEVESDTDHSSKVIKRGNRMSKIGFSTASGRKVTVCEESLKKAKRILNKVESDKELTCEDIETMEKKSSIGFSTASGKKVAVSEESLKKAKRILNDVDSDKELTYKDIETMKRKSNIGFSAASGKKVTVSEESLTKAKRILNEVDERENDGTEFRDKIKYEWSKQSDGKASTEFSTTVEQKIKGFGELSKSNERKFETNTNVNWNTREKGNIDGKKIAKRPSSEAEVTDVRPCKTLRRENDLTDIIKTPSEAVLSITPAESRSWMQPLSADPLEFYSDRRVYKCKTPLNAVVTSPDSEYINKLPSRNEFTDLVGKCSTAHPESAARTNCGRSSLSASSPMIRRKSRSNFFTPYRTSECNETPLKRQQLTQNKNPQSSRNGYLEKNKKYLVRPQTGSILKLRNSSSIKRIPFADYVENEKSSFSTTELLNYGVSANVLSITSENAESYRFKGSDFFSDMACECNAGVRLTDGGVLFLGEDRCAGVKEFTKTFLCSPGVDSSLISDEWVANHYKWIIWKLASYEVAYPLLFFGRSLTPDMLLRQLKYRYDREVDRCERSAIKKILERDDCSSRGMVLCVSSMNVPVLKYENVNGKKTDDQNANVEKVGQKLIMMTDGWYDFRVQLDEYLQSLAKKGKIFTGQKLYIQGAELVGSDQAVSPLEAPGNLYLRIHGNSTRPAKKFSRLGFHGKNSSFSVPIKSLSSDGGLISSINVVVARQYPLQFMEKQPDGSCIFRNSRCEERVAKKFEQEIQRKREKIMYQVQVEAEKEEMENRETCCKRRKRYSLSSQTIPNLCDGKEIFEAVNNASDPYSIQGLLSNEQQRMLDDYKRGLEDENVTIMRTKYEESWKKLCEEEALERTVVPVLKVKLIDILPQQRNKTAGTALLTVWRPSEQIISTLGEGKTLKIYNVYASRYSKGNNGIQISANRCTIYKQLHFEGNRESIYKARKVYSFDEISVLKYGVEVDVVGVVISRSDQSNMTLVYMADVHLNFVRVKIWGRLEDHALQDIVTDKACVAACNLFSQPDRTSKMPFLKYYELSMVTSNPSNKLLRHSLNELRKAAVTSDNFFTKAQTKLNQFMCGESSKRSTPRGRPVKEAPRTSYISSVDEKRGSEMHLPSDKQVTLPDGSSSKRKANSAPCAPSSSGALSCHKQESLRLSRKRLLQSKRRKLDLIPSPPPLSPLPNALPESVRKEFKVPRRIRTESKDGETNDAED